MKTLRDEFAMAALTGILSSPANFTLKGEAIGYGETDISILSFAYADAMMQARENANHPKDK